ncbi:MAG: NYN domain-containing protein [Christensenellales bacterium]|jgi:uncharacterized protein (TIGR00288 family)
MGKSNFAVFVDLENAGAKEAIMRYIIEKVKIRGDILLGKVYGYTDSYSDLKECLLSNTFYVVPSLRYGKNQKNNLDIQLVIDALEVAYVNPLIDSFCIVSGDSDYTPLVGKLKTMGKFVLGISRSEAASNIFINACNEFVFLESVAAKQPPKSKNKDERVTGGDVAELASTVENILEDQDGEKIYASELKDTLTRLRPDFDERTYGCSTFGKLMAKMAAKSNRLKVWTEDSSLMLALTNPDNGAEVLDKNNWIPAFKAALDRFKNDGFDRVNPSILKATIQSDYPDFDERAIGFKRFSDMMKRLEKEGHVVVEMDEARTMLLKIC